jgi:methionine salvage enolase-phosphatase E1
VNGAGASARTAAILLDIEGTTTPIAFVVDQLFPYARKHLRQHLEGNATSPTYAALLDQLREEHAADQRAASRFQQGWTRLPARDSTRLPATPSG